MASIYIEIALEDQEQAEVNAFIEDVKRVTEEHCGFVIDIEQR